VRQVRFTTETQRAQRTDRHRNEDPVVVVEGPCGQRAKGPLGQVARAELELLTTHLDLSADSVSLRVSAFAFL
jgi:hypothetical protein